MAIKKKYTETTNEIGRTIRPHWVDRQVLGTHKVTANTKKELEEKKRRIEKNVKKRSIACETYSIYLEGWKRKI